MGLWPDDIMTPEHVLGTRTQEEYAQRQAQAIQSGRKRFPRLQWRDPWVSAAPVPALISGGRWVVFCTTPGCANAPLTHPDWKEARCFECGAVYPNVTFPAPNDLVELGTLLGKRPRVGNRNWLPHETVDDIRKENRDKGLK